MVCQVNQYICHKGLSDSKVQPRKCSQLCQKIRTEVWKKSRKLIMTYLPSLLFRLIVPSVQLLLINLHWIKVVWHNVLDTAISPFFRSFGKCWGFIRISLEKYYLHYRTQQDQLLNAKVSWKLHKYIKYTCMSL